ncbi:MAG TPA: ABC transporter permease [Alphaproteobacteria bacterium]|nr:ABC transporter permease [Alphaproteobacteria bacterium]
MHTFLQDLRYALRRLKNDPAFASVAVLTLALGIGANTAIFSIVNAALLRPLPYKDPSRVVVLLERFPGFPKLSVSYQNYIDWRDQSSSFEAVAAVRNATMTLTGANDPERLVSQNATANLFGTLGITAELGRLFTAAEDRAGADNVALISHGLWQRRFGGELNVLGNSVTLDNKSYTVIGILPAGYKILQTAPDVVVPFQPWAATLPDDRSWHPGILPIARLKQGISLDQARADMTVIARRLEQQYPTFDTGVGALVIPMQEQLVETVRPALLILMGAVVFVLLIACTNVANLLLARAAGRQREIAVRTAIGASRNRIIAQLLTESVVLAVLGGAFGLMLAWVAMPPLLQLAGPSLPGAETVSLDLTVLGFTTLVALAGGILFGLAPAHHTRGIDLRGSLNEESRGGTSRSAQRARSVLVVAEIAVAMMLLVGAGLLLRSFDRLSNVAPGFSIDHILLADIPVSPNAHPSPRERLDLFDRILDQTAALPGVRSAGATSFVPVSGQGSALHFNIQGRPPKSPSEYTSTNYRAVSAAYLQTLQVPLLQGRWFTNADREGAPNVVIINQSMARTYFPNQSPLGQHIEIGPVPNEFPWMEIVGVVADVKQALASDPATEMYVPFRQAENKVLPVLALTLVIRTSRDPLALTSAVRGTIRQIDPNQPVIRIRSMEQNMADSIAQPRFRTVLLAIFAGVALVLAAVGIFGVMAYSVSQRTRELGVRMALGASGNQILKLILGNGLRLTMIGLVLGLAATAALTRYFASLLFGVRAYDPLTFAVMAGTLLMVALLACYIPARRATRVDPIVVLRHD